MNYISPSAQAARTIRLHLADRGEAIETLSNVTGISHSTLKRRLNGLSSFTIDELDVIARHFSVTVSDLLISPFARQKVSA